METNKYGTAALLLLLGVVFGSIGILWNDGAFVFFAAATGAMLAIIPIYYSAIASHKTSYWYSVGSASDKIAHLDPQQFQALGLAFPKVRVRWPAGEVVEYFDDTNATMEHFRLFMNGATADQIYPERNCNTELPVWAWREIRVSLEGVGYVIKDSAAGNRSWRWATPTTYANLRGYFWKYIEPKVREL